MEFELRQLSIDNGIEEYDMLQTIDKVEYGFPNPAVEMDMVIYYLTK